MDSMKVSNVFPSPLEITVTLSLIHISESSRHETGPGQNEIDFQYANALKAADNLTTFLNVTRLSAAFSAFEY